MDGTATEGDDDVWEDVPEDAGQARSWLRDLIGKVIAAAEQEHPASPQLSRPNPFHHVYTAPRMSSVLT